MKKSAMLQAFQILSKKPILLLLILPVHTITMLNLLFMPDFTKMLDINNLTNYTGSVYQSFQASNIVYMLVSSFVSLISFVCMFVLLPPAMELLRDGAAGVETPTGWFARGLRKHWWKPVVSNLIVGFILGIIVFVLYIIVVIACVAILVPMFSNSMSGLDSYSSPDSIMSGTMSTMMPVLLVIIGVFVLVITAVMLVIQSFFALLLPALADRGFGEAFKLLFSMKGLRKLPKIFGGLLLITLVPGILNAALCSAYILIKGVADGPLGILQTLLSYMHSWPCVFGMLLMALGGMVTYAFQFSVFQQIKDEEAAALLKQ